MANKDRKPFELGLTKKTLIGWCKVVFTFVFIGYAIWSIVSFSIEEKSMKRTTLIKSEVICVKDGDTYVLKIDGKETTVRLIGVDTPESVAPSEYSKENTSEGKTISEIVKQKLQPGDTLYVEYDVSQTDKYGRTLAYLYFENGQMVQEWLLQNGYAQVMTVQPNCKYAERFVELEHTAAENNVGLWNGLFESE